MSLSSVLIRWQSELELGLLCSLLPSCYPLVPCSAQIITEVELPYTYELTGPQWKLPDIQSYSNQAASSALSSPVPLPGSGGNSGQVNSTVRFFVHSSVIQGHFALRLLPSHNSYMFSVRTFWLFILAYS